MLRERGPGEALRYTPRAMPGTGADVAPADGVRSAACLRRAAGWIVAVIVLAAGAATLGGDHAPWVSFGVVLEAVLTSGLLAGAYLASAFGLGALGAPLWRGAHEVALLRLTFGLVVMLSLSHALGAFGLLGPWVAPAALVPGVALAAKGAMQGRAGPGRGVPRWTTWLWAPGVALLIAAASNPPGWLWSSEARGFDALSYHLELPQEWLAAGRISPLAHNVYSYLPGYIEAAFTHLGAASFPGPGDPDRPLLAGLLAGSGWRATSCQFLHAWIAVLACWGISRSVQACWRASGRNSNQAVSRASSLAGAAVLLTPWTLVTGSLAYNEMGVVLLGAGALVAACEASVAAARRAVLVGVLAGGACCLKPTAILLLAPGAGLVWLMVSPRKEWLRGVPFMAGAGLLVLSPWLIRNAEAGGNPVFPHLSGRFGPGHWSAEQHERYHRGHFAAEGALERLQLSVWPAGDGARGLTHTQWGGFFAGVLVLGAMATACAARGRDAAGGAPVRVLTALWLALFAGLGAWLWGTHVQSRFLVPLVVFAGPLIGLGLAGAGDRTGAARLVGCVLLGVQLACSAWTFARQGEGDPNGALLDGPHGLSGEAYRATIMAMPRAEREQRLGMLSDIRTINLTLPPNEPIYLLGDSAPFYIRPPRTYATTWDRSLMARICADHPADFNAWTRALRDSGYTYVLINFGELARLRRAGWLDPDLDPDAISAWARTASAGRTWPDSGRVLIRLDEVKP